MWHFAQRMHWLVKLDCYLHLVSTFRSFTSVLPYALRIREKWQLFSERSWTNNKILIVVTITDEACSSYGCRQMPDTMTQRIETHGESWSCCVRFLSGLGDETWPPHDVFIALIFSISSSLASFAKLPTGTWQNKHDKNALMPID